MEGVTDAEYYFRNRMRGRLEGVLSGYIYIYIYIRVSSINEKHSSVVFALMYV